MLFLQDDNDQENEDDWSANSYLALLELLFKRTLALAIIIFNLLTTIGCVESNPGEESHLENMRIQSV